MGGFFGAVGKSDVISDVFFGTDYHSHLGTTHGGMAAYDSQIGLQREIHRITKTPFRTKFEHVFEEMRGTAAIGCMLALNAGQTVRAEVAQPGGVIAVEARVSGGQVCALTITGRVEIVEEGKVNIEV
jgi:hypothetical protein